MLKILQSQIEKRQADLTEEQQQLTEFKKLHPELALQSHKDKGILIPSARKLEEAKNRTVCFKLAVESASRLDDRNAEALKRVLNETYTEASMPQVTDPTVTPGLFEDCLSLEKQLDVLDTNTKNPLYQPLKDRLGKKQRQIQIETTESSQKYRALLDEKLREAQDRQDVYQKAYEAERAEAIHVNSNEADLDHIEDQIQDTSRDLEVLNSRI